MYRNTIYRPQFFFQYSKTLPLTAAENCGRFSPLPHVYLLSFSSSATSSQSLLQNLLVVFKTNFFYLLDLSFP